MERNLRLDYFKLILSILIITIHTQPLFDNSSIAGWLISNGISRIAVPCFFIASGYFIRSKLEDNRKMKKYILHLIIVYLIWSLIYLPTYISEIEPRSLITFTFIGYYHLWFLPALISGSILLFVLKRYIKNDNILMSIAVILFIAGYVLGYVQADYRLVCNGLIFGFPFITIGYYLRNRKIAEKVNTYQLYSLVAISIIFLLIESYIAYRSQSYYNLFLSLIVLCPALFLSVIKGSKDKLATDSIGKLSAGIFYIHILVITQLIPLSTTNNFYKLPFIVAISILISTFILLINKRLKIFL
ncbi:acyltransferase family protein [Dysgonomonas sp. ZJ279]|uniref:acyltransferase family protein n=1 Tax=Dysgonomonas sp. ZJ279 TaxID=2709796 RepID=UPI0013EAA3C2|nr:acyltransferase [Dysgonomonas sp. ZJ279]